MYFKTNSDGTDEFNKTFKCEEKEVNNEFHCNLIPVKEIKENAKALETLGYSIEKIYLCSDDLDLDFKSYRKYSDEILDKLYKYVRRFHKIEVTFKGSKLYTEYENVAIPITDGYTLNYNDIRGDNIINVKFILKEKN